MGDFFGANKTSSPSKIEVFESSKGKAKSTAAAWIVANLNGIFIILLFLVATAVIFLTSIIFEENPFQQKEFTASLALLAVCSYLLFLSGYKSGEKEFLKTDEYVTTSNEHKRLVEKIKDDKILYMLNDFCADYIKKELKAKRNELLLPENIDEETYNAFIRGDDLKLNESQLEAIKAAKKIKPIKLTRDMLLNKSETNGRSPLLSTAKIKVEIAVHFVFKLITTLLATFYTLSFGFELITDFSPQQVIRGCVCMLCLVLGLAGGVSFGFKIQNKYSILTNEKNILLKEFLDWVNK